MINCLQYYHYFDHFKILSPNKKPPSKTTQYLTSIIRLEMNDNQEESRYPNTHLISPRNPPSMLNLSLTENANFPGLMPVKTPIKPAKLTDLKRGFPFLVHCMCIVEFRRSSDISHLSFCVSQLVYGVFGWLVVECVAGMLVLVVSGKC